MYQRLEPLGACEDPKDEPTERYCEKCLSLEEEKELLQNSLFALTTHFAQVQFRLRQVADARFEDQEHLIRSLEEFAFSDVNFLENDDKEDLAESVKRGRQQQKVLLDKLKLQLRKLGEFDVGRSDLTWDQLMEDLRMKDNLEEQLKTQIADLERFTQKLKECPCKQARKTIGVFEILTQSFSFLQVFSFFQISCSEFRSCETSEWSDLRARLELTIIDLQNMLLCHEDSKKITEIVRKCLARSIRDLIQHGTKPQYFLPIFNYCCQARTHSWDIILFYYNFRKGDEFNSSSLRKLSKSFNLTMTGVSPKANLLYVIEEIMTSHSRYKRSNDSHFRAFVCAALNAKSLVSWLNLIFHCGHVIDTFYYPWSYVATTKCQDSLQSLDVLTSFKFDLPVDLDVRRFHQTEENVFA